MKYLYTFDNGEEIIRTDDTVKEDFEFEKDCYKILGEVPTCSDYNFLKARNQVLEKRQKGIFLKLSGKQIRLLEVVLRDDDCLDNFVEKYYTNYTADSKKRMAVIKMRIARDELYQKIIILKNMLKERKIDEINDDSGRGN